MNLSFLKERVLTKYRRKMGFSFLHDLGLYRRALYPERGESRTVPGDIQIILYLHLMLTFLRKIRFRMINQASSDTVRKSLVSSGSAKKYLIYAIGEVALVVIGILIALHLPALRHAGRNQQLE